MTGLNTPLCERVLVANHGKYDFGGLIIHSDASLVYGPRGGAVRYRYVNVYAVHG